jgi:molybdopterin synthase catalytic subunit
MKLETRMKTGPLEPAAPWHPAGAGAVVTFDGVVRPTENGATLRGLTYEVYEPMTSRQMQRLGREMIEQYALIAMDVCHSEGFVPVGEVSFRLRVAAAHRQAALAAQEAFIDAMKKQVPIWKLPVWDGSPEPISDANQTNGAASAEACHERG